ncbi:MAG: hypothetical protein E7F72_08435 [Haemophilus parainfluenzae]|nr:hypothetical protein [Haemophilus parainfluenzae]
MKKNLLVPFVALTLTVSLGLSGCSSASSRAKADAIAKVNAMPEIGGAHKQEILERIDRSESPVVIQGIVDQAQAENDKYVASREAEAKKKADIRKRSEAAKESFIGVSFETYGLIWGPDEQHLTFKLAKDGKVEKSDGWERHAEVGLDKAVSWKFPDEQPLVQDTTDTRTIVVIDICDASGSCVPWRFTGMENELVEGGIWAGPDPKNLHPFKAQQ